MKKRTKLFIALIVLLILLIPIPSRYKDGGSVRYRALLYDVTKYHQLISFNENGKCADGWNDG